MGWEEDDDGIGCIVAIPSPTCPPLGVVDSSRTISVLSESVSVMFLVSSKNNPDTVMTCSPDLDLIPLNTGLCPPLPNPAVKEPDLDPDFEPGEPAALENEPALASEPEATVGG